MDPQGALLIRSLLHPSLPASTVALPPASQHLPALPLGLWSGHQRTHSTCAPDSTPPAGHQPVVAAFPIAWHTAVPGGRPACSSPLPKPYMLARCGKKAGGDRSGAGGGPSHGGTFRAGPGAVLDRGLRTQSLGPVCSYSPEPSIKTTVRGEQKCSAQLLPPAARHVGPGQFRGCLGTAGLAEGTSYKMPHSSETATRH